MFRSGNHCADRAGEPRRGNPPPPDQVGVCGRDLLVKADQPVYSLQFFQVFLATMLTMTGVSMQFHFGEFVAYHGYSEAILGWITGIGACGSIALRPYAGAWVDRVGCRSSFLVTAACAAAANFAFQFADSFTSICLLRILMVASNATFLTTVAVYSAHVAPPLRRAESLGTIGIGGFLGMITGPAVGDAIFANHANLPDAFRTFFTVVAAVSLLAGVAVLNLRSPAHDPHPQTPPFWTLARRHWPGTILLVPVVFSATLTIHMAFLERYAHHRGFDDIRWFFFVYGPTAIALRVLCRRVPQHVGRSRVCVAGLMVMGVGMLLLPLVRTQWHLMLPAMLMGAGHAFVFPSMVDLAAEAMPLRHRGVATSIALGSGDVGFLLGGIAWGQLIEWRGYEITFVVVTALLWSVALLYGWTRR